MQLLIGERSFVARFAFPENRGLVSVRPGQVPIETILRDVQFPADKPFRERRLPFQNFLPALLPDELARFARPEFLRAIDRFAIHPAVLWRLPMRAALANAFAGLKTRFSIRCDSMFSAMAIKRLAISPLRSMENL